MNHLKYIFLIGCVTSLVFIEVVNAHFRLGRGMERAGEMPLKGRSSSLFEFNDAKGDTKRDLLLQKLESILDGYESKLKRREADN